MTPFIVIGIFVAVTLAVLSFQKLPLSVRLTCAGLILIAGLYISNLMSQRFLSGGPFYDSEPWRSVILYLLMLLGMAASVLVEAIKDRRSRLPPVKSDEDRKMVPLRLDKYDFLYPFLLSLLVYGMLFQQVDEQSLGMASLTLAFQTGFFWDAALKSLKPSTSG